MIRQRACISTVAEDETPHDEEAWVTVEPEMNYAAFHAVVEAFSAYLVAKDIPPCVLLAERWPEQRDDLIARYGLGA